MYKCILKPLEKVRMMADSDHDSFYMHFGNYRIEFVLSKCTAVIEMGFTVITISGEIL